MITTTQMAGLTTRVIGPAEATTTVVLLHGFGAPGSDLVSLARVLRAPVRFVFPEAPLALGGPYGDGRAWWHLDLARLEEELRRGVPRDRSAEIPEGLTAAREQLGRLVAQVEEQFASPSHRVVLGGFSQGAMLALDVALHLPTAPAGLVLMSGTIIAESDWTPRYPSLRGVRIMQSHGKHDSLLPFSIAETLRDRMTAAGAVMTWVPFLGGHEIPPPVLAAVDELLTAVAG